MNVEGWILDSGLASDLYRGSIGSAVLRFHLQNLPSKRAFSGSRRATSGAHATSFFPGATAPAARKRPA